MQEAWVQSLGWEDPLEKGKASHSSIPAWRIPGLQRVREAQEYWSGYPIPSPADLPHPGMESGSTNWAIKETQKDKDWSTFTFNTVHTFPTFSQYVFLKKKTVIERWKYKHLDNIKVKLTKNISLRGKEKWRAG